MDTKNMKNNLPESLQGGEKLVSMSNALTRAGHSLTLAEKRLVALAVAKIDSRQSPKLNEILESKITVSEYSEIYGVDESTAYTQLQKAADSLLNRLIRFYKPSHKRNMKPIEPTISKMHWVGRADYQEGEGWVLVAWWPELLPHLQGLKRQFTSYKLKQTSALRSVYSWRLLELLMRFESTGWAEYTIEDFKASMDAPDSLSDFGQIKRRIIDPAVRELTEKDGWIIAWTPIKAGRRVKSVRFTFDRNPQTSLF
jgi:plasmid replication initiation protein